MAAAEISVAAFNPVLPVLSVPMHESFGRRNPDCTAAVRNNAERAGLIEGRDDAPHHLLSSTSGRSLNRHIDFPT
jgi:hypothetical protein